MAIASPGQSPVQGLPRPLSSFHACTSHGLKMAANQPAASNNGGAGIMTSIDTILSRHARSMKPGETLTLTLVKGPKSQSTDPLLARAAAAKKMPNPNQMFALDFPRVAKFVETVDRPDFAGKFKEGRLIEEDVPEVKDESEDEGDSDDGGTKKKKRRWRKNEPPKQHWVLMEKPEFIEKMTAKRRKKAGGAAAAAAAGGEAGGEKLSSRYEALPEYNPSSYVMLTVGDESALLNSGANGSGKEGEIRPPEHLTVTTLHGFHSFTQPAKIKSLSMHEAEQAINDQRNRMTRYMMHAKKGGTVAAEASAVLSGGAGKPVKNIGMAKSRLLSKLSTKARAAAGEDADDDDVMSDLAYRERKGGSAKARKELLTTLGDGVTVDDDGVLGGQNDAMFGGKRRFGRLNVATSKDANKGGDEDGDGKKKQDKDAAGGDDNRTSAAGNDGMAMQDDFYQRDVGAEYEELDYDANELFDDDDVDVGETEEVDAGGFAADIEDDLDDDSDEYDEEGAAKGIATIAGLKQLMAKDKGELSEEEKEKAGDVDNEGRKTTAYGREDDEKDFDKMQVTSDHSDAEDKTKKEGDLTGVEVDDEGQRIVSLKAVQKEIWLHHGSITMKRLLKIFNIKKKAGPERMNKFREVVRELCTMRQDKIEGNVLVLKPHYSKV